MGGRSCKRPSDTMNLATKIVPLVLIGAVFAAVPVQAHISFDQTETITGTVESTHYFNGVGLIPDVVSFTWKQTKTYDCETGQQVGRTVTSLEYAGSQIEGEDGIYAFLGMAFFGQAGAGSGGMGSTTVSFAVSGTGTLGSHSFGGTGLGKHTITDPDPLCAPPAEGVNLPGDISLCDSKQRTTCELPTPQVCNKKVACEIFKSGIQAETN